MLNSDSAGHATNLGVEAGSKRLELLRELLPAARVMAFLVHPDNPGTEGQINEHQAAAHKLESLTE
jgi:putative tryptophan/tyrosine transport system substrate-binding protein